LKRAAIRQGRTQTKEQEEGHSIAAQRQRLVDYCARKGLDVANGAASKRMRLHVDRRRRKRLCKRVVTHPFQSDPRAARRRGRAARLSRRPSRRPFLGPKFTHDGLEAKRQIASQLAKIKPYKAGKAA